MRRKVFLIVLFVVLPAVCWGAARLEGYTEFFTQLDGNSRVWRLENPQLLGELRLLSSPWGNTEAFIKLQALSNRWDREKWENFLFLKEAHIKFRGNNIEAYAFTGQDRFWLNEPLLNMLSNDIIKDDDYGPKAQGLRLDFWGIKGFGGTCFYSDKSTQYPVTYRAGDSVSTDDFVAARLRKAFLKDRLTIGSTYGRKDYSTGERNYDQVAGLDINIALGEVMGPLSRFGSFTFVGEVGGNFSGWLSDKTPIGWKAEVRDIGIGPLTLIANTYDYDDNFYTLGLARGDVWDDNDYHGHYLQADYRIPRKAINLKGWRYRNKPHRFTTEKKPFEETGGEVYVEFVHGFKARVEYKRHVNKDGIWPNAIFEVSGENNVVKIRTQFRIKDIDTNYEVRVFGFEANANLTEKWKFYTRLLLVDEKTEARETVFAQLQYTGWRNAEFFIEFGEWGQSNDLVNTEWFISHENSSTTSRVFKSFLRLYY